MTNYFVYSIWRYGQPPCFLLKNLYEKINNKKSNRAPLNKKIVRVILVDIFQNAIYHESLLKLMEILAIKTSHLSLPSDMFQTCI